MCMFVSVRAAVQIVEQSVYKFHAQILHFRTEHSKQTCQINLFLFVCFVFVLLWLWKYVDLRIFLGGQFYKLK